LLPVRLGGQDIVTVSQVVDHFGEAELVLRRVLLDAKGQAAMEDALAESLIRVPAPATSRTARLRNACRASTSQG
jgi:hypothetical protein